MNILPEISINSKYLEDIYKDLHSHPELGFEEERTSKIVQEKKSREQRNLELPIVIFLSIICFECA